MSERFPGGIVTNNPATPTGPFENGTAPGIWTVDQATNFIRQGVWPIAGNVQPDPFFENVTLLLHGDGTNGGQNNTFLDSSTNNFTITRNGNTTQGSFSPYGPNWSNNFTAPLSGNGNFGTGNYLITATNAAFELGTGNWTFETWYCPTAKVNSFPRIFQIGNGSNPWGNGNSWAIIDRHNDAPTKFSWACVNLGVNALLLTSNTTVQNGVWYHLAVVRNGNTFTLYVNGVSEATYTNSGSVSVSSSCAAVIGSSGAGDSDLNGTISNLRLVKGTALYTANFTPSTTPLTVVSGTSLLTCADNRFIDDSVNNFSLTTVINSGNISVQRFSPFAPPAAYSTATIGGSGYFDGTGDYLEIPDNAALEPGSSSFTAEAWVYATVAAGGAIFGKWNSAEAAERTFLVVREADATITAYWNISNTFSSITTTSSIALNTWGHVALVRNGSTFTVYINGVASGTSTTSSALDNRAIPYVIGATSNGGFRLTGYISGHRYVVGTAVYTSNFTPPTAPPSAVTNTVLLTNFTNAAIFDNAMMNDLETVGNAQISTSVVKFGTGSMAFDGTGDWLSGPSAGALDFGSGDFTVEGWIYLNSIASAMNFVSGTASNSFQMRIGQSFGSSANGIGLSKTGVSDNDRCAFSFAANTWYYIAVTRASGTIRMFVDGQSQTVTNQALGGFSFANTPANRVGANEVGSENFNGYIDDLRITKGVARYTANFTPPTAAFPNN